MRASEISAYCVDELLKSTKRPLLVGVVGDSGSGKSHFSDLIAKELDKQSHDYTKLDHDEFLRPRSDRAPLKNKIYKEGEHAGKTHWEILENWSRLDEYEKALKDLSGGNTASYKPYERSTGNISKKSKTVQPADIVLVDTSFNAEMMDFLIQIDADVDMIIRRKLSRDMDLRRPNEIIEMQNKVQSYHWNRTRPQTANIIIDNSDLRQPLVVYPLGEERGEIPLNLNDYEAVLFDLDGTIINSMPFHLAGWLKFARRHGVDLTSSKFQNELSGLTTAETLKLLLNREITKSELELLHTERHNHYWEEMQHHLYAIRGFENALSIIKEAGLKTALVTNGSKKSRDKVLSALGIDSTFDSVIGPEDVQKPKPDPEGFLSAAEILGVEPKKCLVFEDSKFGIQAGNAAGMTTVGILTTHSDDQLKEADMLINHFDELKIIA